jgi:valyl-tRNA synthetase
VRAFIRRASETSFDQFAPWRPYVATLAKLESLEYVGGAGKEIPGVVFAHLSFGDLGIAAPDGYDFEVARQRLRKQLEEVEKHFKQHDARLKDANFRTKADPETVTEAIARSEVLKGQQHMLNQQLQQLAEQA